MAGCNKSRRRSLSLGPWCLSWPDPRQRRDPPVRHELSAPAEDAEDPAGVGGRRITGSRRPPATRAPVVSGVSPVSGARRLPKPAGGKTCVELMPAEIRKSPGPLVPILNLRGSSSHGLSAAHARSLASAVVQRARPARWSEVRRQHSPSAEQCWSGCWWRRHFRPSRTYSYAARDGCGLGCAQVYSGRPSRRRTAIRAPVKLVLALLVSQGLASRALV